MTEFTDLEKLRAVEREIAMRRAVYPRQVEKGKMNATAAAKELGVMVAIAADYRIRLNGSDGHAHNSG